MQGPLLRRIPVAAVPKSPWNWQLRAVLVPGAPEES